MFCCQQTLCMKGFVLLFTLFYPFGLCNNILRIFQTLVLHISFLAFQLIRAQLVEFLLLNHSNDTVCPWPFLLQQNPPFIFPPQVSVVKSEETKMRQEDLSRLLYEVQILRSQQENMECQVQDMKQWVEFYSGCFLRTFASWELLILGECLKEGVLHTFLPGSTCWDRDLSWRLDLLRQ